MSSDRAAFITELQLHYYLKTGTFDLTGVRLNRIGSFGARSGGIVTQFVKIDENLLNRGYIRLNGAPTDPRYVVAYVHGGSMLLNKQLVYAMGYESHFDVYENYFIFRNVTVDGYSTDNLVNYLQPNDEITIIFSTQYSTCQLEVYAVTVDRYNNGYIDLDYFEYVIPFVSGGGTLMFGLDYDIYENRYFVLRNGVTINGYVSAGLLDTISIGDLLHFFIHRGV